MEFVPSGRRPVVTRAEQNEVPRRIEFLRPEPRFPPRPLFGGRVNGARAADDADRKAPRRRFGQNGGASGMRAPVRAQGKQLPVGLYGYVFFGRKDFKHRRAPPADSVVKGRPEEISSFVTGRNRRGRTRRPLSMLR